MSRRTLDNILKSLDKPIGFVYIVQPGNLNQPPNIVWEQLIVDDPFR